MTWVLDACAMIALLRGEPGAEVVREVLRDATSACVAHAVNLCEVYYDFIRAADKQTALRALSDLSSVGIRPRNDLSRDFWMRVGELKGEVRRISLADCFTVELSRRLGGTIVTSDRREFAPLVTAGICAVRFIR